MPLKWIKTMIISETGQINENIKRDDGIKLPWSVKLFFYYLNEPEHRDLYKSWARKYHVPAERIRRLVERIHRHNRKGFILFMVWCHLVYVLLVTLFYFWK